MNGLSPRRVKADGTRERVPLDGAMTQNNLGNVQALLNERLGLMQNSSRPCEKADVRDRDRCPGASAACRPDAQRDAIRHRSAGVTDKLIGQHGRMRAGCGS